MKIGIGLGVNNGSNAFNPLASFFAPSDGGFLLDFTHSNTLFQNVDGTTPVTASGQSFGAARDLFKGALVATPTLSVTSRPTYVADAKGRGPQFSVDDFWQINLNLSTYDNVFICGVVEKASDASVGIILEHTANAVSTAGGFSLTAPFTAGSTNINARSRGASALSGNQYNNAAVAAGQKFLVAAALDTNTRNVLYINQSEVASVTTAQGGGNYANSTLTIGSRAGLSNFFGGRLMGALSVCASTEPKTAAQIAQLMAWTFAKGLVV